MAYFDAASAAPLHPVARQALQASLDEGWADPARLYREGRRARLLLDAAREAAAEAVGCRPDELAFTSSGTRSVHTGIAGALAGRRRAGRHLIVSAVEHSSVLHAAEAHEADGGTATRVPVGRGGAVRAQSYAEALRPDTALACLQSANHEVGTVQPVAEVASVCREAGVPLLVDAAQSLGWGPVEGDWSLLTASAHKWGGPSGVGLLVVRKGVRFAAQGPADERESGRAAGFENIPAIVAAAASLRAVRAEAAEEAVRLRELTDRIRERVPELVGDVEVVGDPQRRLPGIVTFSCLYVDGEALLHELDRSGFSVSSGSSCTSSTLTPSHVLKAMGVLSEGNVRVSLPLGAAQEDVDRFLRVLPGAVTAVREKLGAPEPSTVVREDALVVDAVGKLCPLPVIELAKVIGDVPVGGTVRVLADDEAARLDIPAWCAMRGQEYVGEEPADQGSAYVVRRRV
ncbi:cysteine desulfurase/sulfurtransferase TusA family protein [Streptomyces chromofuscus]|uniref:Aminotransferase class V-fold PLP-dependent enzyme n=1 Tax=Streptomyces chromofuscus TaxID=42881 RepID=A0A7M2TE76_STRCW|nr:cysteine desulfurase/sulfurtransferase TusA family protein [Streptomyces chromofuscus]QOV46233.1 aminotransferase class V-fold PLP-dependent enzyme [Streptomyces chromofuscus]GGS96224.1 aminotransferase [Streptomyces chromofuscus]